MSGLTWRGQLCKELFQQEFWSIQLLSDLRSDSRLLASSYSVRRHKHIFTKCFTLALLFAPNSNPIPTSEEFGQIVHNITWHAMGTGALLCSAWRVRLVSIQIYIYWTLHCHHRFEWIHWPISTAALDYRENSQVLQVFDKLLKGQICLVLSSDHFIRAVLNYKHNDDLLCWPQSASGVFVISKNKSLWAYIRQAINEEWTSQSSNLNKARPRAASITSALIRLQYSRIPRVNFWNDYQLPSAFIGGGLHFNYYTNILCSPCSDSWHQQ